MNAEWASSALMSALALAAALGFRHGFDADHIAVVDGMTRARQLQGSQDSQDSQGSHRSNWAARSVGLQFAVGHSAAILVAALLLFGQATVLPPWLDGAGLFISCGLLMFIAVGNAWHAFGAGSAGQRPMGLMSRLLAHLMARLTGRQLHPALVGVAFAVSLDALAQAALFASQAGLGAVVMMALAFGLGMTVADAGNGALLSWCAQRSDQLARRASRWSSGFIATIALCTVVVTLLCQDQTALAQAWQQAGIWVGLGLVLLTTGVYLTRLAVQRARQSATQSSVS